MESFNFTKTSTAKYICKLIVLAVLFLHIAMPSIAVAQGPEGSDEKVEPKVELNSPIREEIQRYLGYEELPVRYLSLPYDMSVNSNVPGRFLEISYLFLMFIPIIFLVGFVKKPGLGMIIIAGSLFLLLISVCTSHVVDANRNNIPADSAALTTFIDNTAFSEAPASVLSAKIYSALLPIYNPIKKGIATISGEKDYVTYPMLIVLFIAFFFMLQSRMSHHSIQNKTLINFIYLFGFLWLLLASGIIWYGFLMLPVGILLVVGAIYQLQKNRTLVNNVAFYAFGIMTVLWVGISMINRISNIRPGMFGDHATKHMFDLGIAKYQLGEVDAKKALEFSYPMINSALEKINMEDESLIYKVGTLLPFFIRKNDSRIFQDNQMGFFQNLINRYPNKATLAKVLKSSGFKYFLVDLQAASIDKTPEKSITRKFDLLLNFLYQNPNLELLATDRRIKVTNPETGQEQLSHEVFGQVINDYGYYAIFEIK